MPTAPPTSGAILILLVSFRSDTIQRETKEDGFKALPVFPPLIQGFGRGLRKSLSIG